MQRSTPATRYTPEFKEQAVKLALELKNIAAASRQLGVSTTCIRGWISTANTATANDQTLAEKIAEQSKIKTLEREISNLRMENEILKKATAYFAADHLNRSTPGSKSMSSIIR